MQTRGFQQAHIHAESPNSLPGGRGGKGGVNSQCLDNSLKQSTANPHVHPDARHVTQGDDRGPFEVAEKGVSATGLAHQGDTRCGADGQHRAAHPSGKCDQQPLTHGHVRHHGEHREHDRDVIHDGGQHAHRHIGLGGAPVHVHHLGCHGEVADEAETAHRQHHAVEKQQGVPLRPGDLAEHVEDHQIGHFLVVLYFQPVGIARDLVVFVVGLLQVITKELQVGQAREHADYRRHVQEVVEADRGCDGQQEEGDDALGTAFHGRRFAVTVGPFVWDGEMHDGSGYQPVHQGRDEQVEKGPEVYRPPGRYDALLPHHQGGDVAERAEGAAGIGRYHDVDTGRQHELAIVGAHRQYHRAHQQRRGQIVCHR